VTVAVAIKVVGVLLIAAMLIIPAAAARGLARTPESMAVIAERLASQDTHVGRAFIAWVRRAYRREPMPRRLAGFFERGEPPAAIPNCVLASYGAVALRYLEVRHAPHGHRVQGERLHVVLRELGRRLG